MKKMIASILIAVLMLGTASCETTSADVKTPSQAATAFVTAYVNKNEPAKTWLGLSDVKEADYNTKTDEYNTMVTSAFEGISAEAGDKLYSAMHERFAVTASNEKIDGDKATVIVKVTHLDFDAFEETAEGILEDDVKYPQLSKYKNAADEGTFDQKALYSEVALIMSDLIKTAKTAEEDLTVTLIKINGSWRVEMTSIKSLFDMVFGN